MSDRGKNISIHISSRCRSISISIWQITQWYRIFMINIQRLLRKGIPLYYFTRTHETSLQFTSTQCVRQALPNILSPCNSSQTNLVNKHHLNYVQWCNTHYFTRAFEHLRASTMIAMIIIVIIIGRGRHQNMIAIKIRKIN